MIRDRSPYPQEAMRLLLDPKRQRFACNVRANPAFMHSDQRTLDVHGERLVDSYRRFPSAEKMAELIAWLLSLPTPTLVERLRDEPLARVKVPKRRAWESAAHEGSMVPVPRRPIVKQTYLRRCLGNLVSEALDHTADPLLPPEAIAYRRGRANPVQEGIREVSRELRKGRRFWAKLDIQNFFPSMPWTGIRRSLERFGYPEDFVQVVMALVQTDICEQEGGPWRRVANVAGAQAGLRESSVLANIYLAQLDREIVNRFGGRIFYRRYSDDILLLADNPGVLEKAVNAVRAWLAAEGLKVKGAKRTDPSGVKHGSRRTSRSLVHRVSDRRVEFLGAEVNAKGSVFIPLEKQDEFARKVAYLLDRSAPEGPVIGFSSYVGGTAIDLFDREDVAGAVDGFRRFWADLGARNLSAVIDGLDIRLISNGIGPVGPTPWVARLARPGSPTNEQVGDARRAQQQQEPLTPERIKDLFERDLLTNGTYLEDLLLPANDESPPGPVVDGVSFDSVAPWGDGGREEDAEAVGVEASIGTFMGGEGSDVESEPCPKGPLSSRDLRSHCLSEDLDVLRCTEPGSPTERELPGWAPSALYGGDVVVPLYDDDLDEEVCSSSSSFFPLAIENSRESPRENVDLQASRPVVGSPASSDRTIDEGCLPGVLRTRCLYLDHIISRAKRQLLVAKLVVDGNGQLNDSGLHWAARPQHESFVVDLIHDEVRRAQVDGVDVLMVKLPDSDLPKRLLRAGRAFRSVPLFDRVEKLLALVAKGSMEVLIAGPSAMPAKLRAAREQEWRRGRESAVSELP